MSKEDCSYARRSFSDNVSDLIADSVKTLREIEKETGIPASSLSGYQDYKRAAEPRLSAIVKLSECFGVSTDYLLGRTSTKTPDPKIQEMCEYTGLTESALDLLHSLHDKPDHLRIINAILEDKTFQAILPQIPKLEQAKCGIELERFGDLHPVEERWTSEGYLVGLYDYFDMLEFRIAQELKLVISNITDPPIEEA